jgi:hypothetical protein
MKLITWNVTIESVTGERVFGVCEEQSPDMI